MGILFHQNDRNREAEHQYVKALKIHPKDGSVLHNLGMLQEEKGPHAANDAEELYRRALKGRPDRPETHIFLGRLLEAKAKDAETEEERRKHLLEAEGFYRSCLKANKTEHHCHTRVGVILANKTDDQGRSYMQASVKHFEKALQIHPEYEIAKIHYKLLHDPPHIEL